MELSLAKINIELKTIGYEECPPLINFYLFTLVSLPWLHAPGHCSSFFPLHPQFQTSSSLYSGRSRTKSLVSARPPPPSSHPPARHPCPHFSSLHRIAACKRFPQNWPSSSSFKSCGVVIEITSNNEMFSFQMRWKQCEQQRYLLNFSINRKEFLLKFFKDFKRLQLMHY